MSTQNVLYGLSSSMQTVLCTPLANILPSELWIKIVHGVLDNQDGKTVDAFMCVCKECYLLVLNWFEVCRLNLYFSKLTDESMRKFIVIKRLTIPNPIDSIAKNHMYFTGAGWGCPLMSHQTPKCYFVGTQNTAYKIDFDRLSITSFSLDSRFRNSTVYPLSNEDEAWLSPEGTLIIFGTKTLRPEHQCPSNVLGTIDVFSQHFHNDVLYFVTFQKKMYEFNLINYINSGYSTTPIECKKWPRNDMAECKYPYSMTESSHTGFKFLCLLNDKGKLWRKYTYSLPENDQFRLAALKCVNTIPYFYCVILHQTKKGGNIIKQELQLGRFVVGNSSSPSLDCLLL